MTEITPAVFTEQRRNAEVCGPGGNKKGKRHEQDPYSLRVRRFGRSRASSGPNDDDPRDTQRYNKPRNGNAKRYTVDKYDDGTRFTRLRLQAN